MILGQPTSNLSIFLIGEDKAWFFIFLHSLSQNYIIFKYTQLKPTWILTIQGVFFFSPFVEGSRFFHQTSFKDGYSEVPSKFFCTTAIPGFVSGSSSFFCIRSFSTHISLLERGESNSFLDLKYLLLSLTLRSLPDCQKVALFSLYYCYFNRHCSPELL